MKLLHSLLIVAATIEKIADTARNTMASAVSMLLAALVLLSAGSVQSAIDEAITNDSVDGGGVNGTMVVFNEMPEPQLTFSGMVEQDQITQPPFSTIDPFDPFGASIEVGDRANFQIYGDLSTPIFGFDVVPFIRGASGTLFIYEFPASTRVQLDIGSLTLTCHVYRIFVADDYLSPQVPALTDAWELQANCGGGIAQIEPTKIDSISILLITNDPNTLSNASLFFPDSLVGFEPSFTLTAAILDPQTNTVQGITLGSGLIDTINGGAISHTSTLACQPSSNEEHASDGLRYTKSGLNNVGQNKTVTVRCPVDLDGETAGYKYTYDIQLTAEGINDSAAGRLKCALAEVASSNRTNKQIQVRSRKITGNSKESLIWRGVEKLAVDEASAFTLECKVPPKVGLANITVTKKQ